MTFVHLAVKSQVHHLWPADLAPWSDQGRAEGPRQKPVANQVRADLLALLDGDAAAVCAAACYKFVRQESSVDETVTEKMCGDEDEGGPGGSESFAAGGM